MRSPRTSSLLARDGGEQWAEWPGKKSSSRSPKLQAFASILGLLVAQAAQAKTCADYLDFPAGERELVALEVVQRKIQGPGRSCMEMSAGAISQMVTLRCLNEKVTEEREPLDDAFLGALAAQMQNCQE